MTTETNTALTSEPQGEATYCPEDDKLRLYVGRVPRDEYEALRAEGWKSTPKQDCDFVATWSPRREDTALDYSGGIIGDEDQSPSDRAADRAERFAGYRDKRTGEAFGHADAYDAGPSAHGYQSKAKATRAADRHDRQASRALNAWDKAEYWTQRTEGVISSALYSARPDVRLRRIKGLEADARRIRSEYTPHKDHQDRTPEEWKAYGYDSPQTLVGQGRAIHFVPTANLERIEASYARTLAHLENRIAYEKQMLGEQGGRLEMGEIQAGGFLKGYRIHAVNKSAATGRPVSCRVMGPPAKLARYSRETEPRLVLVKLDSYTAEDYKAPTPEDLEEFKAEKKALAAEKRKTAPKRPPLVNPTMEEAGRLQRLLDANHQAKEPREVYPMTQKVYSANSGGTYSRAEVREILAGGFVSSKYYGAKDDAGRPDVVRVRMTGGRVIVLTDKPQKALPVAVWTDPRVAGRVEFKPRAAELEEAMRAFLSWDQSATEEQRELIEQAHALGIVNKISYSQASWTPTGKAWLEEATGKSVNA